MMEGRNEGGKTCGSTNLAIDKRIERAVLRLTRTGTEKNTEINKRKRDRDIEKKKQRIKKDIVERTTRKCNLLGEE